MTPFPQLTPNHSTFLSIGLFFFFFFSPFQLLKTHLDPLDPAQLLLHTNMSLPAVRRLTHSSPRTLARISRLSTFSSRIPSISRVSRTPQFSTMAALQSAAPPVSGDKTYDPEIQDMASYIHQYKVDSDLAVC